MIRKLLAIALMTAASQAGTPIKLGDLVRRSLPKEAYRLFSKTEGCFLKAPAHSQFERFSILWVDQTFDSSKRYNLKSVRSIAQSQDTEFVSDLRERLENSSSGEDSEYSLKVTVTDYSRTWSSVDIEGAFIDKEGKGVAYFVTRLEGWNRVRQLDQFSREMEDFLLIYDLGDTPEEED